ncbi:hypothetical protein EGT74_17335 [Chitinophaga lutea]|uniref:Uncharacterized protein n=1 Tax=Chitinophaga lutea TaxID=2488634 RepID=A0A3N4QAM8_9BACT|nr:hypothetical protein EGT74_17335 [Chitinophaga lutea]
MLLPVGVWKIDSSHLNGVQARSLKQYRNKGIPLTVSVWEIRFPHPNGGKHEIKGSREQGMPLTVSVWEIRAPIRTVAGHEVNGSIEMQ